jgi:hypothetical protein
MTGDDLVRETSSVADARPAVVRGSKANTELSLLGAELSTVDVGAALIGTGLLVTYFTTRSVRNMCKSHLLN